MTPGHSDLSTLRFLILRRTRTEKESGKNVLFPESRQIKNGLYNQDFPSLTVRLKIIIYFFKAHQLNSLAQTTLGHKQVHNSA